MTHSWDLYALAVSLVCLLLTLLMAALTMSRILQVRRRIARLQSHGALKIIRSMPLALAPLFGQMARLQMARANAGGIGRSLKQAFTSSRLLGRSVGLVAKHVEELLDSTVPWLRGINGA